jgi:tetratricopeptide (TPR) repeat protein
VQLGDRAGQAITLNQLGNLYATMGRREEAVRLYRQTADSAVQIGDLRREGLRRHNIADELVKLNRFDEARREIERAIECDKPFGHVAEPWKTFDVLCDLERAVGNQPAALEARALAFDAYLASRRDGGAAQIGTTQITDFVKQNPDAARAALDDPKTSYAAAVEITLALET